MTVYSLQYGARPARRGMTLVELMVSVTILVMLISAFGLIVTQAQKVVKGGRQIMQGNTSALAIEQILRADLAQMTKEGFLTIVSPIESGGKETSTPLLAFTAVGPFASKSSTNIANAAIVSYKMISDVSLSNHNVLGRIAFLLTPGGSDKDQYDKYLSDITATAAGTIHTTFTAWAGDYKPCRSGLDSVHTAPTDVSQIDDLWPVLAMDIHRLSFEWTMDGATWAGSRWAWDASTSAWSLVSIKPKTWTRKDATWPRAIRVSFYMSDDGNLPPHEFVIDLPR